MNVFGLKSTAAVAVIPKFMNQADRSMRGVTVKESVLHCSLNYTSFLLILND